MLPNTCKTYEKLIYNKFYDSFDEALSPVNLN